MADALRRFDASADVFVVPLETKDWYPTLLGGDFRAILDKVDRAATEALRASGSPPEGKTLRVVGHSAGGWLARTWLGSSPYMGRVYGGAKKTRVLLTLGTPHYSLERYPFGRVSEKLFADAEARADFEREAVFSQRKKTRRRRRRRRARRVPLDRVPRGREHAGADQLPVPRRVRGGRAVRLRVRPRGGRRDPAAVGRRVAAFYRKTFYRRKRNVGKRKRAPSRARHARVGGRGRLVRGELRVVRRRGRRRRDASALGDAAGRHGNRLGGGHAQSETDE